MALTNKTFSELITFTRSGTATRVNSAGLIEDVAADTPRFDHDPVTGAAKGLLIEESRTNLLLRSEEFDNASWTKDNTTITPNAIASPDGLATADKLVENSSAATHGANQTVTTAASTTYTLSVFAKAAENAVVTLRLGGGAFGASEYRIAFDLSDSSTNVDVDTPDDYGIDDAGNGWYRLHVTAATTTGGASAPIIGMKETAAGPLSYTGDGTSGVYLWGAQLEAGSFATSYIPTPSSFTSRASTATYFDSAGVMQTAAIDEARTGYKLINGTWTSMGLLLEAAATNLCLRSEEFDNASWTKVASSITANAVAAPDGATTMDKLVEDSANSTHYAHQSVSFTSGQQYVYSIYAKAGERNWIRPLLTAAAFGTAAEVYFDLSNGTIGTESVTVDWSRIEDVGGGIYRCSFAATASSTASAEVRAHLADADNSATYLGDGSSGLYVWGAQLEANAYATSYISTTTTSVTRSADVSSSSTVTRNADNASITGTAFSDWFNASEGALFVEVTPMAIGAAQYPLAISDGTANERVSILISSGGVFQVFVVDGGATQANIVTGSPSAGQTSKVAVAFAANDIAVCANAETVATDTSATLPNPDRLTIGSLNGNSTLNGHIKNIKFYPSRLTDAELQALTT